MENAVILFAYILVFAFGLIPTIKEKYARGIFVYLFLIILSACLIIFKLFIAPDSKSLSEIITNFITGVK